MLYLRHEPTKDPVALKYLSGKALDQCRDVQAYHDRECTKPGARWTWYSSQKPTKRRRHVMVNCSQYPCQWVS